MVISKSDNFGMSSKTKACRYLLQLPCCILTTNALKMKYEDIRLLQGSYIDNNSHALTWEFIISQSKHLEGMVKSQRRRKKKDGIENVAHLNHGSSP